MVAVAPMSEDSLQDTQNKPTWYQKKYVWLLIAIVLLVTIAMVVAIVFLTVVRHETGEDAHVTTRHVTATTSPRTASTKHSTEATTTETPSTEAPTTAAPTTEAPTTEAPTTVALTSKVRTTQTPTTVAPTTDAPTTVATTTEATTTEDATTVAPTTEATTTEAATTVVPTTEASTTEAPTTEALSTEVPTTKVPTTKVPTTVSPTTAEAPTTAAPTTVAPNTGAPTTVAPTTEASTTVAPTAEAPTTVAPTTVAPTKYAPATAAPRTEAPTTVTPTTVAPTTEVPTTVAPTTKVPTTEVPTTEVPTTEVPTRVAPTTEAPTTVASTTESPTTEVPITEVPTTEVQTTKVPTTETSITVAPTTEALTTEAPTTAAPTTKAPTTEAPTTAAPTIEAPTTVAPTTKALTTVVPTTAAPTTVAPTTVAPTTVAPTTEAPTTKVTTTVAPTTEAPTTADPITAPDTCLGNLSFSLLHAIMPLSTPLEYSFVEAEWPPEVSSSTFSVPERGLYMFTLSARPATNALGTLDMLGMPDLSIRAGRTLAANTGGMEALLPVDAGLELTTVGTAIQEEGPEENAMTNWGGFSVSCTMASPVAFTSRIPGTAEPDADGHVIFTDNNNLFNEDWTIEDHRFIVPLSGLYVIGYSFQGSATVRIQEDESLLFRSIPHGNDEVSHHSRLGMAHLAAGAGLSLHATGPVTDAAMHAFRYGPSRGPLSAWFLHIMVTGNNNQPNYINFDTVVAHEGVHTDAALSTVTILFSGRYFVTVTLGSNSACSLILRIGGQDRLGVSGDGETVSRSTLLRLQEGDQLRVFRDCRSGDIDGDTETSFGGFLVMQENFEPRPTHPTPDVGDLSFSLLQPESPGNPLSYTYTEADWEPQLTPISFTAPNNGLYMFSLTMAGDGGPNSINMHGYPERIVTTGREAADPSTGSIDCVLPLTEGAVLTTEGVNNNPGDVNMTSWGGFGVNHTMGSDISISGYIPGLATREANMVVFSAADLIYQSNWETADGAFMVPESGLYVVGFSVDGSSAAQVVNMQADDTLLLASLPRPGGSTGSFYSRVGLARLSAGQALALHSTGDVHSPSVYAFLYQPRYGIPAAWAAHRTTEVPSGEYDMVYTDVAVNEGGHLNEATSTVTVPLRGRYYINISMGLAGNNVCRFDLLVNERVRASLYRGNFGNLADTMSRSVILRLSEWDQVRVIVSNCHQSVTVGTQPRQTSFSGFLIHPDS